MYIYLTIRYIFFIRCLILFKERLDQQAKLAGVALWPIATPRKRWNDVDVARADRLPSTAPAYSINRSGVQPSAVAYYSVAALCRIDRFKRLLKTAISKPTYRELAL